MKNNKGCIFNGRLCKNCGKTHPDFYGLKNPVARNKSEFLKFKSERSAQVRGTKNPNWNGVCLKKYGMLMTEWNGIRDKVFKRDNYHCCNCNASIRNIRIHVHHKDGNTKNNVLSNLCLLCISCHMSIHKIGSISWNRGLTKKTSNSLKSAGEKLKGRKFSDETIKRMSDSAKGHIPWNKDKTKTTDERLKKCSDTIRNNYKMGKFTIWSKGLTKETNSSLNIMSKKVSNKLKGRKLSNETREKMSDSAKKRVSVLELAK